MIEWLKFGVIQYINDDMEFTKTKRGLEWDYGCKIKFSKKTQDIMDIFQIFALQQNISDKS